jgi:hypothetical protein
MNARSMGMSAALFFLVGAGCAKHSPAALPGTAVLTVGATTTGKDIDDLTFAVRIDGAATGTVRADGGVFTARNIPPGEHTVRLDLASHCRVEGPADRRVTLSAQRTTAVKFSVSCR